MIAKHPKISIVIPAYNCECYVARCLDHILVQTYENIEIIIVDDGSTDNTYEICRQYGIHDERVMVLHKENGGPSSARNYGLAYMSGDLVAFIDADDIVEPNYIDALYSLLQAHDADIASCGYDTIRDDGTVEPCEQFELELFGPQTSNVGLVHYPYTVWHMLFKREVIEGIKFDESIFYLEDLKYVDEAFMRCHLLANTSKRLYHRISHSDSFTERRFQKDTFPRYFTLIKALDDMCKITCGCTDLQLSRLMSLLRESVVMLALMKKLDIVDKEKENFLRATIKNTYAKIRGAHLPVKQRIIAWMCLRTPRLYCRIKHVDFSNATI